MDLTVAICMYNAGRWIEETLGSVMAQTRQDFHLLIVDDCSTDNSVAIVERFFNEHPRQYELIKQTENKGIAYERYFAERHASTKYMMFLDADDILMPDAVEKMYDKITLDSDLMAVGCYLDYIDENGKKIGGGIYLGEKTKEGFYEKASKGKLIFMQPTAIYNRECALKVGGYKIDGFDYGDGIRWQDYCEDLDLWTRMSDLYAQGKAIIVLPEVLCHYRKTGVGLSGSSWRMTLKMLYVKNNLKRRRRGEPELTFVAFLDQMSAHEMNKLKKDARAADALRRSYYSFRKGHVGKGLGNLWISLRSNPGYIVDKIKHNVFKVR